MDSVICAIRISSSCIESGPTSLPPRGTDERRGTRRRCQDPSTDPKFDEEDLVGRGRTWNGTSPGKRLGPQAPQTTPDICRSRPPTSANDRAPTYTPEM